MKLSLLARAAENHVIPEQVSPEVTSWWAELTAEKTVIIPVAYYENWKDLFVSSSLVVVGEGSDNSNAVPMQEAIRKLASEEEIFVVGDKYLTGEYWEKYNRIYLSRYHCDLEGKELFPLLNRHSWTEATRTLHWQEGATNISNIIYQREKIDISISIVLSTCNQSAWLEKTLWGYQAQTVGNFELIIADDGSRKDTYDRIETLRPHLSYAIKHVWHEDKGFRKCDILNKGILAAAADYLLFSDGDCIPRKDFVAVHLQKRQKGRFLSGGYHKLSMPVSEAITQEEILSGKCFDVNWLKAHGMKNSFRNNKLTSFGFKARLLNTLTTTKPTWNGHNASGWLEDILATNGFDERMQYGGQDREFGERLENSGIHGKQVRYSAICIHLDHARGYRTRESIQKNLNIRKHTRKTKVKRTPFGIV